MENKKDIGKLFKEKLDGLDKTPNENLWAAINDELQEKKKKRRAIPFYFYYTGAALLLLFIGFATKSFWMPAFENFNAIENISISNDKNLNGVKVDENNNSNQNSNATEKDANAVTVKSKDDLENQETIVDVSKISLSNESEANTENTSTKDIQTNSGKSANAISKGDSESSSKLNSDYISVGNSNKTSTSSSANSSEIKNKTRTSINNDKSVAALGERNSNNVGNNNDSNNTINQKASKEVNKLDNQRITEIESNSIDNSSYKNSSQESNSLESETETITNSNLTKTEVLKETDSLKVDSIAIKRKAKMELRLAAQRKLDSIEAAKPKYYVFAHAEVSAFNHFGKQSFIDSRLDNYDTTTELQYNYGIYFGFIANEKLNLRIGVNKASLSVTTKNVPLISPNPNTEIWGYFSNVDYNKAISNEQLAAYFGASDVTLTQNIRFIEIPLEAKYKVYDGTIEIEAIGGISSLFLSKNEVKAEANEKFLYLGKVNNGRQASASLNLGAGFSYKIGKNLQLNVEPMFKYYFRSFEVSNKPYSLNVQAGLQYNFSQLLRK